MNNHHKEANKVRALCDALALLGEQRFAMLVSELRNEPRIPEFNAYKRVMASAGIHGLAAEAMYEYTFLRKVA